MIILKPKRYPFRDRAPDWVLSLGLLTWGLAMSSNPNLFYTSKGLNVLLSVAPQIYWTVATILIGLLRIFTLTADCAWRPLPHARAIGSVLGILIWGSLFIVSLLNIQIRSTSIATYGMLLAFEFMALWWSAGDAKVVDELAKSKKANGSI